MIKLQDFARQQGVTDRAVQKQLKKHEHELGGLYERKGPNGTWLSEEACDFLRRQMKAAPVALYDDSKDREIEKLNLKIDELSERIHQKDILYAKLQEKVDQKSDQLEDLRTEMQQIEEKRQVQIDAAVKAAEDALHQKLTSEHQKKIEDMAAAHEQALAAEKDRKLTLADLSRFFKKGSGR